MKNEFLFTALIILFITATCSKDDDKPVYDTTPYILNLNGDLPDPVIPADNLLTKEKVKLGRMLFYEKVIQRLNTSLR